MKAKQRTLIVLAGLILVLTALWGLVTWLNRDTGETADEAVKVTEFDASTLESITYTFEGRQVRLTREDGAWALADEPGQPLQDTLTGNMAAIVSGMTATRRLEEAGDPADYGLDSPAFTVEALAGGQTYTFRFGDVNAMTDDMYLSLDGDENVYTIAQSNFAAFQYGPQDLYQPEEETSAESQG